MTNRARILVELLVAGALAMPFGRVLERNLEIIGASDAGSLDLSSLEPRDIVGKFGSVRGLYLGAAFETTVNGSAIFYVPLFSEATGNESQLLVVVRDGSFVADLGTDRDDYPHEVELVGFFKHLERQGLREKIQQELKIELASDCVVLVPQATRWTAALRTAIFFVLLFGYVAYRIYRSRRKLAVS